MHVQYPFNIVIFVFEWILNVHFFNTTDYEIFDEKLGNGSFGTVYKAQSRIDIKEYAAKIINIEKGFDRYEQMLFFRESLRLHKLSHPSIVKFKAINMRSFSDPTNNYYRIFTSWIIEEKSY